MVHSNHNSHEQLLEPGPVTVIEPRTRWRLLDFKELWAYRELFVVLALRDIKVRYKQTALGALWAILQPFTAMVVFTVIFGRLAKIPSDGYPYAVFVYAGLLPWTFFAGAISSSGNSLVGSANLISKVYFPRLIIPTSSLGAHLLDFAISFTILLGLMVYFGVGLSVNLLAIPFLLVMVMAVALGLGTILSTLTVSYRDFRYVVPFLVQTGLFVTPVIYPVSLFPNKWQWVLYLNPMAGLVEGFRAAVFAAPFNTMAIGLSCLIAMLLLIIGVAYFEQVERRFADII